MDATKIHGIDVQFPIFLPDATNGVVRGLSSIDLAQVGIKAVVVNTYHLNRQPGGELLEKNGGIKKFMQFPGLVVSDSGGFQVYSLLKKNPLMGKVVDEGLLTYTGPRRHTKQIFTPEQSIQMQFAIGSDIMICLDDFTPETADEARAKVSVERTLAWAKRCRTEFDKQVAARGLTEETRPLLFAVSQGHHFFELRGMCIDELIKIGFDGYGLGGMPLKPDGSFDYEICAFDAEHFPDDKYKFALGIGKPNNIARLRAMGFDFFDCVIPTRAARHRQVYIRRTPTVDWKTLTTTDDWFDMLSLGKSAFADDQTPLDPHCDCPTCSAFSRAYIHHLFKTGDYLAGRLATLHNLHFYVWLTKQLQQKPA